MTLAAYENWHINTRPYIELAQFVTIYFEMLNYLFKLKSLYLVLLVLF